MRDNKLQSTLYGKAMLPGSAIAGHGAVNILAHAPSTHPALPLTSGGRGGKPFLRARGVSFPLVPKRNALRPPDRNRTGGMPLDRWNGSQGYSWRIPPSEIG